MNGITVPFHKTRIAPTPSGYLHLGNAYSFARTAALAHKHDAQLLLRIDDLDRDRVQKAYVEDIFDTLHFLDIPWQDGPAGYDAYTQQYTQLQRLDLYNQALETLQRSGAVFACNCSRADVMRHSTSGIYPGTCLHKKLPLDAADVCWRLDTAGGSLKIKDLSGKKITAVLPPAMHYFVVRKKDRLPAYQLTSVIDDLHFGVDMIVRGADLWNSTLAQLCLAKKINLPAFSNIAFYHHPLLLDAGGEKLSKSAGATSIQYLRRQGKTAADIYAMMSKMAGLVKPVHHWRELVDLE